MKKKKAKKILKELEEIKKELRIIKFNTEPEMLVEGGICRIKPKATPV